MKVYKKALITGGAQRIGSSIAEFLAKKKMDIAIQYNSSKKEVFSLQKKIKNLGVKCEVFQLNFNENCNFETFFNKLKKKIGNIDLLVNNASTFEFDTIKKTNYKIFDSHINVNLRAPYFLSKNFVESLNKRNGLIINIIDQRVKNLTPYFTSYTLSKSALYTLTKSLAVF